MRLRTRAAALLGDASDPDSAIYADIKAAYNLRSWVVHGSNRTPREIELEIARISATERERARGVKGALAMDRIRDLVRRAILARGYLSDIGKWPLGKVSQQLDVDGQMVDPAVRDSWRKAWRDELAKLGLSAAAGPATDAETEPRPPAGPPI